MATRGSYVNISMENSRGHPDNVSFMQVSTKIDGFEQKDSQGFENSYNSYEQYPLLEKFFIFTIYQNYTLALNISAIEIKMIILIFICFLFQILLTLKQITDKKLNEMHDVCVEKKIASNTFHPIKRARNTL